MKLKKLFALALAVCMMALAVPAAFAASLTLDYGTPGSVLTLDDSTGSSAPVNTVRNTSSGTSATARAGGAYSYDAVTLPATPAGIEVNKIVEETSNDVFHVKLESFVTGGYEITTETEKIPADITLVLDISESMNEYIEVGSKYDLTDLDAEYGSAAGIYMMKRAGQNCAMRYVDGDWQYYGIFIGGNTWKTLGLAWFGEGKIYVHKMDAMKIAALKFVDTVLTKANADNVAHTITIISCNDAAVTVSGKTTVNNSNVTAIKNTIKSLGTSKTENFYGITHNKYFGSGSTDLNVALTTAQTDIGANPDKNRSRVVLVISDGKPTAATNTNDTTFDTPKANAAIATSKAIKALDKTYVYTVGVFAEASTSSTSNENLFLQYLSSNYKNATAMNSPGDSTGTTYYKAAPTSLDTNAAFEAIFAEVDRENTTGGVELELDAGTVLTDTLTTYFQVERSTIKTYTAKYKAHPSSGREFYDKVEVTNLTVGGDLSSVTVEGFDYTANAVTDTNNNGNMSYSGNKLIVEFDIVPKAGFLGGVNVPTNDLLASNIEEAGVIVAYFPKPDLVDVDVPQLKIEGTAKNIYLGSTLDDTALAALTEGAKLYVDLSDDNQIEVKDAWQTAFVDLSYSAAVGDTTTVTAYDLTCTVNIAGTDDILATATTQSAGALNVYKPVLSTSDCTVFLCGDEPSFTTAVTWKNGDTEANPATMIGTAPAVLPSYSQSTAFTDCTPVTVTVNTINGKNVVKNTHYIANDFKVHVVKPVIENGSAAIKLGSSVPFTDQIAWASKCVCNTYDKPSTGSRDLTVNYYSGTSLIEGEEYPDTCTVYTKKAVIGGVEYKDANNNGITGTFTAHVHAPSIVGKNSVIYMGNGTTLDKGDVTLTWNRACMKNDGSVLETGKDPVGVAEPDYQFSESKDAFTSCANYNVTLTKIGQKSVSGYTSSFTVHVLKPDVLIKPSEQVIYYGDEAVFIPSISWSCTNNQHTDLSATEGVPTATEKDCKLNYQDMHFTGCKDDVTASVTIETVKGNKVYSSNTSTVHVLKPEITAANKTLYWTQPYGLNSSMTTAAKWKCKHTDNEKVDLSAAREPDFTFVNKGVVETNETDLVLDDCATYVVTATINGLEFPLDDNSNSVTIHVVKPVISCADTAIYLGNSVDLNAQMTEDPAWKCTTSTCPGHVTLAVKDNKDNRVAPALDHEFSTVENEAAYEPSTCTPVTVTSTITTGSVSKDVTPTQNTFTVHVYVPQFTVTTQDLWADCGSEVPLYDTTKAVDAIVDIAYPANEWVDRKADYNKAPTAGAQEIADIAIQFSSPNPIDSMGESDVDVNVIKLSSTVNGTAYAVTPGMDVKTDANLTVIKAVSDEDHDFTVHVNKFKAVITNNGTQNAIYTLSNGTKVAVEAGKSTTVAGLICGKEYVVSETADNDWTWRYATEATENTAAYTVGSVDNKPETDSQVNIGMNYGSITNAKWLADEDCVVNNAATPNCTIPVKKEDDEEVTNV